MLVENRLRLARQLLIETPLPIIDVAFASGFSSLRRFNDAFSRRYGFPPSRLRKEAKEPEGTSEAVEKSAAASPETLSLHLAYRPPFDWSSLLGFLQARTMPDLAASASCTP